MAEQEKNFSQIYEEYYPKVFRYLRRLVGEAEDVAQEVRAACCTAGFTRLPRSTNPKF